MESISFTKFKECLDRWAKQKEKGQDILSRLNLGESSPELEIVIDELRSIIQVMYEEFQKIIESLGLELALEDESVAIPQDINTLRNCIDMYDQELMVKECIRGIVCDKGFSTRQHLAGSTALWKAESYIDEDIQQQVKNHP
ncbi:hypothetical protein K501DRAFT_245290 [Backusella circina FSU 941]|nr:hypothetical protein K501DRAFT_245290 [Backusella circina FSU 941]